MTCFDDSYVDCEDCKVIFVSFPDFKYLPLFPEPGITIGSAQRYMRFLNIFHSNLTFWGVTKICHINQNWLLQKLERLFQSEVSEILRAKCDKIWMIEQDLTTDIGTSTVKRNLFGRIVNNK